jgi:hypothetical protein
MVVLVVVVLAHPVVEKISLTEILVVMELLEV